MKSSQRVQSCSESNKTEKTFFFSLLYVHSIFVVVCLLANFEKGFDLSFVKLYEIFPLLHLMKENLKLSLDVERQEILNKLEPQTGETTNKYK